MAVVEPSPSANADRIGLNFIRPDINRPGCHDFVNSGEWLVSQYVDLGVRWNRLAFSWVRVQPQRGLFNWEAYDRIVNACVAAKIDILATLGGHFDDPPVPTWAGTSLHDVVTTHPELLEEFIEAWVARYHDRIGHWEMLNEPFNFHKDLTVTDYVDRILEPGHRIVKAADPTAKVLPCSYLHLPRDERSPAYFWEAAPEFCDIYNYHVYQNWGYYQPHASAADDEAEIGRFRDEMEKHGEGHKAFWITEAGWWGTGALTGSAYQMYKIFPGPQSMETRASYTGRETLTHPIVLREDVLRAEWMGDLFPRLFAIPGCEKIFLWVSMDEFEGGFDPDALYGVKTDGMPVRKVDLWGIIAGDRTWRNSAFVLQDLLRESRMGRHDPACLVKDTVT